MGDQTEAQWLALEVGLLSSSWSRLKDPHQLNGIRRGQTVVMLECSFDWPEERFQPIADSIQACGADVYHENALRAGKVPL